MVVFFCIYDINTHIICGLHICSTKLYDIYLEVDYMSIYHIIFRNQKSLCMCGATQEVE